MIVPIRDALASGLAYLSGHQQPDGHWEDFDLPVGRSDAWVTAYAGLALERAGLATGSCEATRGADRAGMWLGTVRPYEAGWGFNSFTGPDADSTAYAICLLRNLGRPVSARDERWLRDRWVPREGFATYDRPDNWGLAHPDVTPAAFRALSAGEQRALQVDVVACLRSRREADGTWPSYWWRTRHYSTFLNGSLLRELGIESASAPPVVSSEDSRAVHSAFDVSYVLANAWLSFGPCDGTERLARELTDLQRPDGSWPGAPILRVARHDAKEPWTHPEGDLFADTDHLFTTASAVRVLAIMAAS